MTMPASRSWIRSAILIFAAIAPIWTIFWFRSDWIVALIPLLVSHMLLLYPTLVPQSQWWGPVIRSFDTSQREVWITVDDGPTLEHTRKMLEVFECYRARATFFVIGARAKIAPQLVEEILRRGHTVANHTFTHPSGNFWCAGPARISSEVDRCNDAINGKVNGADSYFRAPAGLKNPFVHPALARHGMWLIGWTVRGLDTWRRDPSAVAAAIKRKVYPGAIILLHEGHHLETSPDLNPRCLELTLAALSQDGYQFVIPLAQQLRTAVGKRRADC
jgi:peptidoglycan/xylan/chitin deacetylase (PgdA/CDA1 family)